MVSEKVQVKETEIWTVCQGIIKPTRIPKLMRLVLNTELKAISVSVCSAATVLAQQFILNQSLAGDRKQLFKDIIHIV